MEYTVQRLASLAGVSARTLRYYDSIGLLKPRRISNGYRIYGANEVDRLQQILFYRELGMELADINHILSDPGFDHVQALKQHKQQLLLQRRRIDSLLQSVDDTIAHKEGRIEMPDKKKFEAFKQKLVDENEAKYGEEIREKYGEEAVAASNAKMMNMTEEQYTAMQDIEKRMFEALAQGMAEGDPSGEAAQQAVDLHRQWLGFTWSEYSKEAHMGLAQMYVDDPRFTKHYDDHQPGMAAFLRDAVAVYTK